MVHTYTYFCNSKYINIYICNSKLVKNTRINHTEIFNPYLQFAVTFLDHIIHIGTYKNDDTLMSQIV